MSDILDPPLHRKRIAIYDAVERLVPELEQPSIRSYRGPTRHDTLSRNEPNVSQTPNLCAIDDPSTAHLSNCVGLDMLAVDHLGVRRHVFTQACQR